jgi:type IV pilus assembly protein PilB
MRRRKAVDIVVPTGHGPIVNPQEGGLAPQPAAASPEAVALVAPITPVAPPPAVIEIAAPTAPGLHAVQWSAGGSPAPSPPSPSALAAPIPTTPVIEAWPAVAPVLAEVAAASPSVTAPAAAVGATPQAHGAGSPAADPANTGPGGSWRLGDLLVAKGIVTAQQLDFALAEQSHSGLRLGAELVRLGMLTERAVIETLAQQLSVPVADLRLTVPDPLAVARLPQELARRLEVIPIRMLDRSLEVAIADVLDGSTRTELEAATGCPVITVLAPSSEIRQAIERCYLVLGDVAEHVRTFEAIESARPRIERRELQVDDNAPVVQVVTLLLTQAVRDRASDIHIEPQENRVRVRFRVDGVLQEVTQVPQSMAQSLVSRIKIMANMNIVERRRPQDGQLATEVDGRPLDVRVATTATVHGEKAVLRILDKTRSLRTLPELGMNPEVSDQLSALVSSPFGMVVCAGPTGSGKTTTLYAALKAIDDPSRNITTIEDPVEYVLSSINQIQVNNQAGITFADGLRSILRQDPDVILVGEVRDVETARIAVQSALTGHFVLSSVHATDSATAVQRFRDMGVEPFLITASVLAVVSQRLVRRICQHCVVAYEPTMAERVFFEQSTGRQKSMFVRGAGCNLCAQTGYSQRVGVYELLRITESMKELVMRDAGAEAIRALAVAEGMRTLREEVLRLVEEDQTTLAEATRTVLVAQ